MGSLDDAEELEPWSLDDAEDWIRANSTASEFNCARRGLRDIPWELLVGMPRLTAISAEHNQLTETSPLIGDLSRLVNSAAVEPVASRCCEAGDFEHRGQLDQGVTA